jgi:glycosyltransferase involved in cell wall biosynthesis
MGINKIAKKKSTVKNTENDELFVSFLKMLNTEDMVRLEGSVDNFYTQINLFISGRDFRKTKAYIEAKINDNENYIFSIFEEKNKKIIEKIKNLHAKVTIITPTYNRDNLIPHTIKSVLAQEYKDYVYIILDDGSNDNTKKVVLDLIKGKKNCFYIYNENIGEAETVNLGWNLCESGYFLQVNSDDTIEPNLLSEVVPLLEKNTQHVLAYPDFYFINDEGEVIDECKNEDWDFINALSDFSCHAAAPGTFIRKDSFKGLKKIKDGRFKYINDINMLWNMALKGDFLHVPKPLASWRSHAEGISTDRYKSINEVTTWVDEYFSQKNLPIQVKDIELKCRQSIDDYCIKLIQDSDTDSVVANYTRDLNERFKKLLLEKEDLLASKSWKITKPLRYIFIKLEDFKSRIRK